jgi:TRAP-type C4-dicarboxylate transport system permease small subunit
MVLLDKTVKLLVGAAAVIAALLFAAIFLLVNVEIFCRYILNTSTLLADEYGGYFFAVAVYTGLNHSLYHDRLLKIDLPGAWATFVNKPIPRLIVTACTATLNVILLYAIWQTFSASVQFGSRSIQASRTPLAYPQGGVTFGIALLALVSLFLLIRQLIIVFMGQPEKTS